MNRQRRARRARARTGPSSGRVYDPTIGRFLSADPIIQTLATSQAINPFSYVMNQPLTLTDPSGMSWLSKLFSGIGHFLKKWGPTILGVVLTVIGVGPLFIGLWTSLASAAINGGNIGSFALGIAIGAIAGAIAGPIGGKLAGLVGAAGASIGARIVAGAITGAIAGGISSAAMGGDFWSGALVGAVVGGLTAGLDAKYGKAAREERDFQKYVKDHFNSLQQRLASGDTDGILADNQPPEKNPLIGALGMVPSSADTGIPDYIDYMTPQTLDRQIAAAQSDVDKNYSESVVARNQGNANRANYYMARSFEASARLYGLTSYPSLQTYYQNLAKQQCLSPNSCAP